MEVILISLKLSKCEPKYSPRMWRWSYVNPKAEAQIKVFSTYVEVILFTRLHKRDWNSILHVCGGDPNKLWKAVTDCKYSPRMWRWSCHKFSHSTRIAVFSTYVEVIPWIAPPEALPFCILHVCGGDPVIGQFGGSKSAYSPRMWRWSLERQALNSSSLVFSTYVEVILHLMTSFLL